jgi:hypothetical protein
LLKVKTSFCHMISIDRRLIPSNKIKDSIAVQSLLHAVRGIQAV